MSVATVSIVIPTHNRADLLAVLLDNLSSIAIPARTSVDLVVVANGCTDDTMQIASRSQLPMPMRIVDESQLGLNYARNRSVRETAGEIVAFLDDDVVVDEGWLEGLIDVFEAQSADIVGGRVSLQWCGVEAPAWLNPQVMARLGANERGDAVFRADERMTVAIGANFAVRREVFRGVGLFRTGLDRRGRQLIGGGETDLVRRAVRAGYSCFYAPRARAHHRVDQERLSQRYLHRAAFWEGYSGILALERFGAGDVVWQIGGRSIRLGRHLFGEAAARLGGHESRVVGNRLLWMHALGGFAGIGNRLARGQTGGPVERL